MSCKGLKGDALKECKKKTPTWKNFAMANQARNNAEGVPKKIKAFSGTKKVSRRN